MHTFVEGVRRSLAEQHDSLAWQRVTMPGLNIAWAGVNVPVLDTGGRPWVWEIVTPRQYDASPLMQDDPMVLAVPHDVVIAEIQHRDQHSPIIQMQVPVRSAPEEISISHPLSDENPWSVRLEIGWTVQALGEAAQCWIDREAPGSARLNTPKSPISPATRYKLHPAIDIESAAFDRLLTLDPHDAAVVTSLLAKVHDALLPFR